MAVKTLAKASLFLFLIRPVNVRLAHFCLTSRGLFHVDLIQTIDHVFSLLTNKQELFEELRLGWPPREAVVMQVRNFHHQRFTDPRLANTVVEPPQHCDALRCGHRRRFGLPHAGVCERRRALATLLGPPIEIAWEGGPLRRGNFFIVWLAVSSLSVVSYLIALRRFSRGTIEATT